MKSSKQIKKDEKVSNTDVAEKALVVPIDSGVCDSGVRTEGARVYLEVEWRITTS